MNSNDKSRRKRYAVLVPACMLAPGLQVERKPGPHWGYEFLDCIMRFEVDIIPLPCSESTFCGFVHGLQREKRGVLRYEALEGYTEHCAQLAKQSAEQIADMQAGGYEFLCMLGVENSPSCAVSRIYSNKGTLKRAGIFYQFLQSELELRNVKVPAIGILRGRHKKAIALLEKMLSVSVE
ncbi:hypothetical protein [Butyricicoccus pullicaecorum]|uniref:DUF523 domain-containing protein n=1 Tax=Butyricicoccus pullicaecorum 1.2 TaxID=1203606 RepID=R8W472_9FIRM|nr:hypothetical protein [Butyricicoccus pullicaecorum]EOQ37932.1 hypothetical protein HMPREF1526_00960 [Butyricicoccus pullicaecorum 1.2]SKA60689.1 Predicted secreted protein [Butyricicoccus pullicaecorum DSM 23266]